MYYCMPRFASYHTHVHTHTHTHTHGTYTTSYQHAHMLAPTCADCGMGKVGMKKFCPILRSCRSLQTLCLRCKVVSSVCVDWCAHKKRFLHLSFPSFHLFSFTHVLTDLTVGTTQFTSDRMPNTNRNTIPNVPHVKIHAANALGPEGAAALANVLKHLKKLDTLELRCENSYKFYVGLRVCDEVLAGDRANGHVVAPIVNWNCISTIPHRC